MWDEARFGPGMEDPAWGSRLYDAAFVSAYRIGHYERAFGLMNNLSARLITMAADAEHVREGELEFAWRSTGGETGVR